MDESGKNAEIMHPRAALTCVDRVETVTDSNDEGASLAGHTVAAAKSASEAAWQFSAFNGVHALMAEVAARARSSEPSPPRINEDASGKQ